MAVLLLFACDAERLVLKRRTTSTDKSKINEHESRTILKNITKYILTPRTHLIRIEIIVIPLASTETACATLFWVLLVEINHRKIRRKLNQR